MARWSVGTKRVMALVGLALALLVVARASDVVTPFMWAGIFAYVFGPLIAGAQRRTGAGRGFVVAGLFLVLGLVLYGLARLLVPVLVE